MEGSSSATSSSVVPGLGNSATSSSPKKKSVIKWDPVEKTKKKKKRQSILTYKKKKAANITIQDLLEGKGMESVSNSNQIVLGLKRDLQKTLNLKRQKLNIFRFKLRRKENKISQLRAKLKELMIDGEAMGVNDKKQSNERLSPNKLISNRPIYHLRTDLTRLIEKLEKKNKLTTHLTFRIEQYKHLLDTKVRVLSRQLAKTQKQLGVQIQNSRKKCTQTKRMNIKKKEEMGKVQTMNRTLKQDIKKERKLWEKELSKRRDLQMKKREVQKFYKKISQNQMQIERNDAFDLDEEGERKLEEERVAAIAMEHLQRKTLGEVQQNALEEEAKYKLFFSECGVDTEASVNTIFSKIAETTTHTKELTNQRDALRLEIEKCKSELTGMTTCITEGGFSNPREYSPEITNLEELLEENHAKMVEKVNHYRFLNDVVNSVEIAFASMNDRYVYGGKVHKPHLSSVADVRAMTNRLVKRIEQIVQETMNEDSSSLMMRSPRKISIRGGKGSSGSSTKTLFQEKVAMHQRSQEFLARHVLSQAMIQSASKIECKLTDYNVRVETLEEAERKEVDRTSRRRKSKTQEDLEKTRKYMKTNLLPVDPEPPRRSRIVRMKKFEEFHGPRPRAQTQM